MSTDAALRDDPRDLTALEDAVEAALAEARRLGASAAEAALSTSTGLSVTARLGEVETVEHTRDQGLGVTVYFGRRKGSASTTDMGREALLETVAAACGIARHTAEDECAGLADPERLAREIPDLDLYHPWDLEPEAAIDLAIETEQAARDVDPRITNSDGATVATHVGNQVYGNTHGFLGGFASSRHVLSCTVIGEDAGGMQRDYWYTVARAPEELESPRTVGRKAGERTVARLGARRLGTRETPVVYAAEVATGLLRHFVAAVSGGNLYRESSFLLGALGKPVFPDFVRIHEQPHLRRGLGSAPFDAEGVATRDRDLVAGGVLEGYVLSTYTACKLGLTTTGNAGGVHNLTLDPGPGPDPVDLPGLLREMGTGVLITELIGMGVNITTGDYSRGAAGFWVENGEIAHPVQEITVAGSLPEMLRGVRRVGADVDARGNLRTGSVLVERMTVAGE